MTDHHRAKKISGIRDILRSQMGQRPEVPHGIISDLLLQARNGDSEYEDSDFDTSDEEYDSSEEEEEEEDEEEEEEEEEGEEEETETASSSTAKNDPQMVTVPITLCLMIMVGYIYGGAVLFSKWEDWNILDGSYFCFISLMFIANALVSRLPDVAR
ncbi:putative E3 ubiquitin-protein ligase RING1a [Diaphorina citri]|uniref:E3 ubiquitin-protein ligase RING1a n=1 Tax=Diaphorina citri TaxID=121845 RepID=A0A1S4E8X2_DIACI|nr:putative E3 ubiquitin-protein ligase RING1a [Diaphorina citri]